MFVVKAYLPVNESFGMHPLYVHVSNVFVQDSRPIFDPILVARPSLSASSITGRFFPEIPWRLELSHSKLSLIPGNARDSRREFPHLTIS